MPQFNRSRSAPESAAVKHVAHRPPASRLRLWSAPTEQWSALARWRHRLHPPLDPTAALHLPRHPEGGGRAEPKVLAADRALEAGAEAEAGPAWLRDFFPGYFALVMGTGIVAVAARLMGRDIVAWPLFCISLAAYPVLWIIVLARLVRFPRAVLADFASHERGPTFLTIVAANGVLGSQFAVFNTLTFLLPTLLWFSFALWLVLVYGFLSVVTVSIAKPDLEHGLNGAWLLLVVATESIAVLAGFVALKFGAPPPLVFAALAFYLLGVMLYVSLSTLILFRWIFRPMYAAEMGAPWWINMGAVAIATLAGARLVALPGQDANLILLQRFVTPFTVLLWATGTFWIPLLVIMFVWKELQRGPRGYDPSLWSVVFPLGMYVAATHEYATEAHMPFLYPISVSVFWIALLAWVLTFIGMWVAVLRRHPVQPHQPDGQAQPG